MISGIYAVLHSLSLVFDSISKQSPKSSNLVENKKWKFEKQNCSLASEYFKDSNICINEYEPYVF